MGSGSGKKTEFIALIKRVPGHGLRSLSGRKCLLMFRVIVFQESNEAARKIFVFGKLGEISTIHFARWISIDHGQRLLFLSNYDGSWTNYLGDFRDEALGLNPLLHQRGTANRRSAFMPAAMATIPYWEARSWN